MTALEFTAVVWVLSALAGFLGALTGLGGGVVVVPALTLALGVDMKYAIGASLVSVIATSSGAAAAYVREGFSNIRIGMFLEIATTLGRHLSARFLPAASAPTRWPSSSGWFCFRPRTSRSKARRRATFPSNPMRSPRACVSAAAIPSTASRSTTACAMSPQASA